MKTESKVVSGAAGGGGVGSKLFEVLRNPALTGAELTEYSGTNQGMSDWAYMTSLPSIFLESPIIEIIRKCPMVEIALSGNAPILSQFGDFNYSEMESTIRALEIANMSNSDFNDWVVSKADPVGYAELILSPDAIGIIRDNQEKSNMVVNDKELFSSILASEYSYKVFLDNTVTLDTIFSSMESRYLLYSIGKTNVSKFLLKERGDLRTHLMDNYSTTSWNGDYRIINVAKNAYLDSYWGSRTTGAYKVTIGDCTEDGPSAPSQRMTDLYMTTSPTFIGVRMSPLFAFVNYESSYYGVTIKYIDMGG